MATRPSAAAEHSCRLHVCHQILVDRTHSLHSHSLLLSSDLTPSFDRHPEQKTVAVGSSTSFYCINSGSVPLADILWEKDGRSFTDGSVISTGIDSTRTTSSLQIANAEKKTQGSYRCVATNRLLTNERVESNAAYLTVNG